MFAMAVGVLTFSAGVSMVGSFSNLAGRMFGDASSRVNPGTPTVNMFRLGGLVMMLIGVFRVATALP